MDRRRLREATRLINNVTTEEFIEQMRNKLNSISDRAYALERKIYVINKKDNMVLDADMILDSLGYIHYECNDLNKCLNKLAKSSEERLYKRKVYIYNCILSLMDNLNIQENKINRHTIDT